MGTARWMALGDTMSINAHLANSDTCICRRLRELLRFAQARLTSLWGAAQNSLLRELFLKSCFRADIVIQTPNKLLFLALNRWQITLYSGLLKSSELFIEGSVHGGFTWSLF